MSLLRALTARGFIHQATNSDVVATLLYPATKLQRTVFYLGIDPTAPSLHVGHLVPLMMLAHLQSYGHIPIALVGGATGRVGDPSFRNTARESMPEELARNNVQRLTAQIRQFSHKALDRTNAISSGLGVSKVYDVSVLDNADWHGSISVSKFLDIVGDLKVNAMMGRDSMKMRSDSGFGPSYRELSYQVLQAYDFWYLFKEHNCTLQIGGSDQWGNIVTGIDLIGRRTTFDQGPVDGVDVRLAQGLTTNLLTTRSGEKFGKSAGNAVWLNESMTSVYEFYQFWIGQPDEDVEKYLKLFTFLNRREVETVMATHLAAPEKRHAQQVLAREVTALVHNRFGVNAAESVTQIVFGELAGLKAKEVVRGLQGSEMLFPLSMTSVIDRRIPHLAVQAGLVESLTQARTLIQKGGLYLNNVRVTSPTEVWTNEHLIDERLLILRSGKHKHKVVYIL
ncbi:tyrosyl-tRNA synthetase [Exidia glandulosa HHB12029]|uniref:Tyrosine--tRNA ligase n=1 Tax=Exidia glandulosa HHB12029 TaxID=1314781 RepID=A0A165N5E3_EXIGL|nr:tyrosyl-tRNA synthetase [Exidia glandulosa HHB12029]